MNINIDKLKIPSNWVLVKLDNDFEQYHSTETGDNTGLYVAPWGINQASHVSVTGTVVKLPNSLIYHGQTVNAKKLVKDRSDIEQKEIARLRKESMAYDVPMEVPVGIKVYFEYTTRLNAFKEGRAIENEQGKFVFIPYDLLVMAFKPGTNFDDVKFSDVYMLNGHVLIKPMEYAIEKTMDGVRGIKTETDLFIPVAPDAKYVHQNNLWYARVITAGCSVKSYIDFPRAGADSTAALETGTKIVYDGRQQKRLEVEHHRVIFKKHTLYRIHRKDIIGRFAEPNIGKTVS